MLTVRCAIGTLVALALSACSTPTPTQHVPAAIGVMADTSPSPLRAASDLFVWGSPDGDSGLRLTSGCPLVRVDSWTCTRPSRLEVIDANQRIQTLTLPSLRSTGPPRLYRGPLDGRYAVESYTFVLADINFDQRGDLLIWAGNEGAYGHKSFDVYLREVPSGRLTRSVAFSEIGIGRSPPVARNGRLLTGAKSGCCIHVEETYEIEDGLPRLIQRMTTDTNDANGPPVVRTEYFGKQVNKGIGGDE